MNQNTENTEESRAIKKAKSAADFRTTAADRNCGAQKKQHNLREKTRFCATRNTEENSMKKFFQARHESEERRVPARVLVWYTVLANPGWRYRLGVRTEDSQSSNPGSIPGSATRFFSTTANSLAWRISPAQRWNRYCANDCVAVGQQLAVIGPGAANVEFVLPISISEVYEEQCPVKA